MVRSISAVRSVRMTQSPADTPPPDRSDLQIIAESPHFEDRWYAARYPDVAESGLSPEVHYLTVGALLRRDPGPDFCTGAYLDAHRDVAASGVNPLVHYERYGRQEGRDIAAPPPRPRPPGSMPEDLPELWRYTGRAETAKAFKACALRLYTGHRAQLATHRASILLPVTPAEGLAETVDAVLGQTHAAFELLVLLPEGATAPDLPKDARIRLVRAPAVGRAAFWNAGLAAATGRHIFYHPAGTIWDPDHLAVMVTALAVPEVDCALSVARPEDPGRPVPDGYGLDGFCHHAALARRLGGFEPALAPFCEWDLSLRYFRDGTLLHAPLAEARAPRPAPDPPAFNGLAKLIRARSRPGGTTRVAAGTPALNFAIKTHTSFRMREHWGEYFFSLALKTALEALGHTVRIDYPPTWYSTPEGLDDVVIVLRGRQAYTPRPGEIALLWVISHPDLIPYAEYDAYDAVFVASPSYPALLSLILGRDTFALLQCSDPKAFAFHKAEPRPEAGGVFVGNSRNALRPIVQWCVENFIDVRIFGQDWEKFIPAHLIAGQHIANEALAPVYARAGFVLNDHWASMKDFGAISNRVFDVVGCGGRLISDYLPSIDYLFGDIVRSADTAEEFTALLDRPAPTSPDERRRAAEYVHTHHSFDARAAELCRSVEALLLGRPVAPEAIVPLETGYRPRVGLLFDSDDNGRPSAEAFVRLICPLTSDAAQAGLEPVALTGPDDPRLEGCDAVAVLERAIRAPGQATELADRLTGADIPLLLDTGDPVLAGGSTPAPEPVRRILRQAARQIWSPSPGEDRDARVVPNRLDPRLWRSYADAAPPDGPVRFLYLRSASGLDDPDLVYAAFDALNDRFPEAFELVVPAASDADLPDAPWLHHVAIEGRLCSYPDLARLLTGMGRFDAGIAPLRAAPSGPDIRVLEYSALGAATLTAEADKDPATAALTLACGSTRESWLERLTEVLEARSRIADLGAAARAHLWRHQNVLDWPDGPAHLVRACIAPES